MCACTWQRWTSTCPTCVRPATSATQLVPLTACHAQSGLIVPGLGDVGNRFFSTWDDEPSPMEGHAPGAAGLEVPADADTGAAGKKRRLDA